MRGAVITYLLILSSVAGAQKLHMSTDRKFTSTLHNYTAEAGVTDMFFNLNRLFLCLDGGIYLPKDTTWLLPPREKRPVASVAFRNSDTSLLMLNSDQKGTIGYNGKVDSTHKMTFQRTFRIEPGNFRLAVRDTQILVWGNNGSYHQVGLLQNEQVTWFVRTDRAITSVFYSLKGEIIIAAGKRLINYSAKKPLLELNTEIFGVTQLNDGNFAISTKEGVFLWKGIGGLKKIFSGASGYLATDGSTIYMLSRNYPFIVELRKKK